MNYETAFKVGQTVEVKNEYRKNPVFKGSFQGTVAQANQVGITMVYDVNLDGRRVSITHGALEPTSPQK